VPFIESARESVLLENQSFNITKEENMPEHFLDLLKALRDRQRKGLDVRIVFRSGYNKEREIIRNAVKFGFKGSSLRFYDKCHTKGIVVDRKRVLLGSQNWTGAGTGPNRDASLLIDHPEAGAYFADLFEYSWRQIAKQRVRDDTESMLPILIVAADQEAEVPPGYRRVSWREWMEA
jgi:phosphatidylserine/phosphatidylglycerophosphate/cardiolipin synthase-like enzyme